jgi:polyisoprenoid-binding protein YceI
MRQEQGSERGGIFTFLVVAVVVVVGAAAAFWWFVFRSDAAPPPKIEDTAVVAGGAIDGNWTIQHGSKSFVQYRVKEQFVGAVLKTDATGRTDDVTGTMTVNGTLISNVRVTANLAALKSDKDRRDNAIRGNGLQSSTFPTATFVLTGPVTLPQAPRKGEKLSTTAAGAFTLHGITKQVIVPLEGRWDGRTIQVVGTLPIRFADYGITPPNIGGFVTVADTGAMELQLFFTKL